MSNALICVDLQRDFCEGGNLPVEGGLALSYVIGQMIRENTRHAWNKIVATKDWHSPDSTNSDHFAEAPNYIDTWPTHCVAYTQGAEFAGPLVSGDFNDVFVKGWDKPAYSGFEGLSMFNNRTTLAGFLRMYEVGEVDVCGIATDYCVKATVLDALDCNLKVNVIADLTVAVGDKNSALEEMERAGAKIV